MLLSGLPELVDSDEDLARFITQSNQFTPRFVRPSLFLPRATSRNTSVSRHASEPRDVLWEMGAVAAGGRPLYGAAIFKAAAVRAVQLEVIASEPPPMHAAIEDWPWDSDPELQKARQKELASAIAAVAGAPVLK